MFNAFLQVSDQKVSADMWLQGKRKRKRRQEKAMDRVFHLRLSERPMPGGKHTLGPHPALRQPPRVRLRASERIAHGTAAAAVRRTFHLDFHHETISYPELWYENDPSF